MLLLEERRANGDTTRPPQAGVLLQKSSPLSEKHPKLGGTELRGIAMRMVRLTLCIGTLVAMVLLGGTPAAAQDQTLTGWFSFIVADSPSDAGFTSETTYTLTEDAGARHELLIDIELMRPLGGPVALNRKRVTVVGEWAHDSLQFRVYAIERALSPLAAPSGRTFAQPAPDATHVRSSQAWVTILCRFADATDVTPYPISFYEGMMGASYPGLEHYWREVSDGNLPNLNGSVVVGWYNLPHPKSYYASSQPAPRVEDGRLHDYDPEKTAADCAAAADEDIFFPDFDGFHVVLNQDFDPPISNLARGGGQFMTLDGQSRFWSVTWMTPEFQPHQHVWAHEMGHGLGLLHSSGPYDETYDSYWDVMSGWPRALFSHPEYGDVALHTIAYHKDFLGWIPPDRKYVAAPNSTQTITLERLAQPGEEGYLLAEIPIGESRTDFYTIEARLFAGYDEGIPDEAIVIHTVDTTREDRLAQVVDVDNNGDPNDEGAMWTPGEIFTDTENNLQVSIDAASASGYRVTINTDPTTFSTCIDFLSPSSHVFGPGQDGASIPVEAPRDCAWSATSNTAWIGVTTGGSTSGSGSIRYTVAANPGPAARTGTLSIGGWTFTVTQAGTNEVRFADDMESGINGWHGSAPWTQTTASGRSGTRAWTWNSQGQSNAPLWSPVIDLTEVKSATLTFWHQFSLTGEGLGHVWVAPQNGQAGVEIKRLTGTQGETQVSLDLTPFAGQSIQLAFNVFDITETGDFWTLDDVAVFSTDFVSPVTLGNPQPHSFQSGVGVISGWACHAQEIVIELNGVPYRAGYGTTRPDTQERCGDTDNGFSLLWNWNNLGAGTHTVRALIDGVEFANTTVRVTTFGEAFLRGASGTFNLPNFPTSGDTTGVQWEEALQNFVITDGSPAAGGGYNRVVGIEAILGNPSLGSVQSGVTAISGWACEAEEIIIELNGVPYRAGYGTTRPDTQERCGDADNGFSLLWNWNNLGAGTHTVRALIDGVEFANTTVRVTTFGEQFLRGVNGTFPIPDFPRAGETKRLRWEQSLQNFVIVP